MQLKEMSENNRSALADLLGEYALMHGDGELVAFACVAVRKDGTFRSSYSHSQDTRMILLAGTDVLHDDIMKAIQRS